MPSIDGSELQFTVENGEHLRREKTGNTLFAQFARLGTATEFTPGAPPFGPRGRNERELTLNELVSHTVAGEPTSQTAARPSTTLAPEIAICRKNGVRVSSSA